MWLRLDAQSLLAVVGDGRVIWAVVITCWPLIGVQHCLAIGDAVLCRGENGPSVADSLENFGLALIGIVAFCRDEDSVAVGAEGGVCGTFEMNATTNVHIQAQHVRGGCLIFGAWIVRACFEMIKVSCLLGLDALVLQRNQALLVDPFRLGSVCQHVF